MLKIYIITAIIILGVMMGGIGYFIFQKPTQREEAKQQTELQQIPNVKNGEETVYTEDWQIYTNARYGYAVKYPNEWEQSVINDKACFGKIGIDYSSDAGHPDCAISISVTDANNPKQMNLDKLIEMRKQGQPDLKAEKFKVSGEDAVRITNYGDETYFYHQGNIFVISNTTWKGVSGFDEIGDVITEMLNTIKFIDLTTDWKTYRNAKYGFEVRYPQGWGASALDVNCPPGEFPSLETHNLIGFSEGEEARNCLGPTVPGVFVIEVGLTYPRRLIWGKDVVKTSEESLNIDGISAMLTHGTYSSAAEASIIPFSSVTFKKDEYYFVISNYDGEQKDPIFRNFISSFKFSL